MTISEDQVARLRYELRTLSEATTILLSQVDKHRNNMELAKEVDKAFRTATELLDKMHRQ